MRRAAYIKALGEASKLPEEIPELKRYFNDKFSPRRSAIFHIKAIAGTDPLLFNHEQDDVINWKETDAENSNNNSTINEEANQEGGICT